jgi:HAD superfamily phosphoserine phosphatase-like hydrolase
MSNPIRIEVSIDDQRLDVLDDHGLIKSFPVSTATKGVGFREGSYRTPLGRFRIAEKIGGEQPLNTIFKQRMPVGIWQPDDVSQDDLVLSRILRMEGLDEENKNTMERFVYIHGTNHEELIGQPASWGCVRLTNADMVELYDMVAEQDEIFIRSPVRSRGKLMFFDCDSTLSSIEGIDELARSRGPEVFAEIVALTDAAMNGEIALDEVFPKRMEIIRPDRKTCEEVAAKYIETVTPGALELIEELKRDGWTPVIISGGFEPLIRPLARFLGIDHVEAVPLYLDEAGEYAGYGRDYPTTRNMGKNEIIREWKAALLPERTGMMGDGISDLETRTDVDVFIGYGGVVARPLVKQNSSHWLTHLADISAIMAILRSGDVSPLV